MLKECNLVELFSGIGSQAKALKNLGVSVNTVGTCEWDVHAIAAYDIIHNSAEIPEDIASMDKNELLELLKDHTFSNSGKAPLDYSSFRSYSVEVLRRIYASLVRNHNFVDVSALNGAKLPEKIDILTYSFPCQDLSNVGAFHGYNKGIDKDSGSRSSLLWQVGRILLEMRTSGKKLPRYLLMENVPTLLSKRHLDNFKIWINELNDLGYVNKYYQLNASSFGLPQNRPRLLMISVYVGNDINKRNLVAHYFSTKTEDDVIHDYRSSRYFKAHTVKDLLRINYTNKKIFAEAVACTPNDTPSRRKIWEENPQIILADGSYNKKIEVVRTITTKQDRNPNSGNLYFDSGIKGLSKFRYLTPRECLLFMGFTDDDYKALKKNNIEFHRGDALFARDKIIRMAGNSIPVKLLEGVFYQIIQIDSLITGRKKHAANNTNTDYSNMIRSYLFAHGIRSRINKEPYPQNASLVYSKYKTAIYICEGLEDDRAKSAEAIKMGWNAITLWPHDLYSSKQTDTLTWIEACLRENTNKHQEVGLRLSRG